MSASIGKRVEGPAAAGDFIVALARDLDGNVWVGTEDKGVLVSSTQTMIQHTFNVGQTSFLLYRNPGGAVRPGTLVTILFGDLKIEHFVAR